VGRNEGTCCWVLRIETCQMDWVKGPKKGVVLCQAEQHGQVEYYCVSRYQQYPPCVRTFDSLFPWAILRSCQYRDSFGSPRTVKHIRVKMFPSHFVYKINNILIYFKPRIKISTQIGFFSFLKYTFILFAAHLTTSWGVRFENH
jgi:hypothetical protein